MAIEQIKQAPQQTAQWGPFSVEGQHVLVTGAAKGIGRGIATRFVEGGAHVVFADVDIETAKADVAAAQASPGSTSAIYLDVSDASSCEHAISETVELLGSLDVLINDAGVYPTVSVLDMPVEFFDHVLDVNLRGLMLMSKFAGLQMAKQKTGGKIINVASIDSLHPSSLGLAAYDASKGGVWSFTKNFALEMAKYHVNVNAIAPGSIATEGTSGTLTGMTAEQMEQMMDAFTARIPLGRIGEPDDIATVAIFLASSAAKYMTGSLVVVDGGYLLT